MEFQTLKIKIIYFLNERRYDSPSNLIFINSNKYDGVSLIKYYLDYGDKNGLIKNQTQKINFILNSDIYQIYLIILER